MYAENSGVLGLSEGNGLGGDVVLERATLQTREDGLVELAGPLLLAEHEPGAGTTQRLVRRGADEVRPRHRRGMCARCDESGDVRHVDHQHRADLLGDVGEALEVDDARIRRSTGDDHLGTVLLGQALHLVVVDGLGLHVQPVRNHVEPLAREVHRRAVGQVAAHGEVHAEDGVARIQRRVVDRQVGLRAGMRLHVRVVCAEELTRSVAREVLDDVDLLAAAVVALAR